MRYLLYIGLFGLALTAVTQADAQDRRRAGRQTTVMIASDGGRGIARPVRASAEPPHAVYDSRRTIHKPSRAMQEARRDYLEERDDLAQIVNIAVRWNRATASRDRHAQAKVDRRLDAWLDREVRESIRKPHNQRYTQQVRGLSRELQKLDGRAHHACGPAGPNSRGQGRGRRGYDVEKARILDELVLLSQREVQRAQAQIQRPFRLSFAYR